jgi:hypothetical protein
LIWPKNGARRDTVFAIFESFPQISKHIVSAEQFTKYIGSFIGKDFKAVVQLAPMLIYRILSIVDSTHDKNIYGRTWVAVSRLSKLAYSSPPYPFGFQQFIGDVEETVKEVLTCMEYFPSHKKKLKIHLLSHLSECIRSYGPLSLIDAERNESQNGTIRSMLVNSNRHSPSRDTARKFSLCQTVRHLANGGWILGTDSVAILPGHELSSLFEEPALKRFLKVNQPASRINPRLGDYYFFLCLDEKIIGRVVSKNATEKTCVLNVLDRSYAFDRFGNCGLVQTEREATARISSLLHRAHVMHDCSNDCRLAEEGEGGGPGGRVIFRHVEDGRFILNSFSFTADHEGKPDYYS